MVRKIAIGVVLLLLVAGAVSVVLTCEGPKRVAPPEEVAATVKSSNAFSADLYARLRKREGNLVVSPLNVWSALVMLEAGARSDTADNMASALHLAAKHDDVYLATGALQDDLNDRSGVTLQLARAVWVQDGVTLTEAYRGRAKTEGGAEMREVDFVNAPGAAVRDINAWADKKTRGKLKGSLPADAVNRDTRLVVSSAIYFKGKWQTEFDEDRTRDEEFHVSPEKTVITPMMRTEEQAFDIAQVDNIDIIDLPYTGGELSMTVMVPQDSSRLGELEDTLHEGFLDRMDNALSASRIVVVMPRFGVRCDFNLREPLTGLGFGRMFDVDADFSGITPAVKPLFVQSVVHSAFIEVDEKGTEAGGATHIHVGCAMDVPPGEFVIDRPFLFLIRDRKTGSILFMGRVVDPSR